MSSTKIILLILFLFFLLLIILLSSFLLINNLKKIRLSRSWPPPGYMFEINDGKMHLSITGESEQSIIFMSGYRTAAPSIDFKPLAKRLSNEYKTVIIENFGYGWSSNSFRKRSVENIIEENRNILKLAGIPPPYILLPHSMSGIYATYWAKTYPEEIVAVIGLDTSVANQFDPNRSFAKDSLLQPFISGTEIDSNNLIELGFNYDHSDNYLYTLMSQLHKNDVNLISEGNQLESNLKKIEDSNIPDNIPTFYILSNQTQQLSQDWSINWYKEHLAELNNNDFSKIKIIDGGHYIHRDNPDDCYIEIINFLDYAF